MKYDDKNEAFFKNLAAMYAEKDGEALKNEVAEIEKENMPHSPHLDRKVQTKMLNFKMKRLSYLFVPVAACFILFAIYFGRAPINNNPTAMVESTPPTNSAPDTAIVDNNTPRPIPNEVELLSAKLPNGYNVTDVDYDNGKTIYYIANDTKNEIVLTTEAFSGELENEMFQEININNTRVYGLVKNDYSVITYEKDNILYKLTSKYNYHDLIEISKNLI